MGDYAGSHAADCEDDTLNMNDIRMVTQDRVDIRMISVLQIRKLRAHILRPGQAPEMSAYLGDYAPDTLHLGAFKQRQLVGIASIMHQAPKDFIGSHSDKLWLLRGMATLPEVRGQGYGTALVRSGCAYAALERGLYLWCNGRESAMGFYEKLGFVIRGDRFELPDTGPHYRFWRELSPSDAAYAPY